MRAKLMAAVGVTFLGLLLARYFGFHEATPHTVAVRWSIDGRGRFGEVRFQDGEPPVLLWFEVPGGYCYNLVFTQNIREHLLATNSETLSVQYVVSSTLGKPKSHDVRVIDGLKVSPDVGQEGGLILMGAQNAVPCDDFLANQ